MAKKPRETQRLQVVLALKTHAFLSVLAEKGTHGVDIPAVARTLIEQGIRQAIKDGFIDREQARKVQQPG
jgi:hypothetical protein